MSQMGTMIEDARRRREDLRRRSAGKPINTGWLARTPDGRLAEVLGRTKSEARAAAKAVLGPLPAGTTMRRLPQ